MRRTGAEGTLVEFFGMPGGGKSTVARRVANTLQERDIQVNEPTYILAHECSSLQRYRSKLCYAVQAGVREPELVTKGTHAVLVSNQHTRTSALKSGFNWWFVTGAAFTGNPRCVQLLDQGFVQAVWSIEISRSKSPNLETLLAAALSRPARTLVITVDVSPVTAHERMLNRDDDESRIGSESGYTIADAAETTDVCRSILSSIVNEVPTVDSLTVKNERPADLDLCVDRVTSAILDLPTVSDRR